MTPRSVRVLTYGGITVVYVSLWFALQYRAMCWRPWIELLNGATWPDNALGLYSSDRYLFSGFLALRVMLNASTLIAAIVVLVEFFLLKKRTVMKVSKLLDSRQVAVLNAVATAMNMQSKAQRAIIDNAAKEAAKDWNERYLPGLIGKEEAQEIMNYDLKAKSSI